MWLILTLDCEQSARLTSESLDRRLYFAERWAVRAHNAFCRKSRNLARQLKLLDQAFRGSPDQIQMDNLEVKLSPEAKIRIADQLRD